MLTILSDVKEVKNDKILFEMLENKSIKYEYFDVNELNIMECRGCNGCKYKTFGKCIQRDDGDLVYPSIMQSEAVWIITTIHYGSYSFKMKRVLDKFGLAGSHFYLVTGRKLKKGGAWNGAKGLNKYYAIGIKEQMSNKERDAFRYLINEIYELTTLTGSVYTVEKAEEIARIMEEAV